MEPPVGADGAQRANGAFVAGGAGELQPYDLRAKARLQLAGGAAGDDAAVVEDAAHAAYLFFGYVTSFSYQETISPAPALAGDRADALQRVGQYLSTLPPGDFPHLTRCAAPLSRPGLDSRFAFGLDRLIRGLST
jgi:Tetracyclin repressor-like, C-terminal domain